MLIGLIADTHIPDVTKDLPSQVKEAFQGVDLILHAGDIYIPSVLDELEKIAPVLAASGDDDSGVTLEDKRVKTKHILKLDGRTIWLVHERPYYLKFDWWKNKLATGEVENPDIVIFGHDHRPDIQHVNGILLVSSGSPTFLEYRRGLGTVGLLKLSTDNVDVDIIHLEEIVAAL